jgi:hypothetical protein
VHRKSPVAAAVAAAAAKSPLQRLNKSIRKHPFGCFLFTERKIAGKTEIA